MTGPQGPIFLALIYCNANIREHKFNNLTPMAADARRFVCEVFGVHRRRALVPVCKHSRQKFNKLLECRPLE
jgi:hypothetical protein